MTPKALLGRRKFVFVASDMADRLDMHIGDALEPGEFAILGTLEDDLSDSKVNALAGSRYGHREETRLIEEFVREARGRLVKGVDRAAAALAIADSVLQPLRGFPMLIDRADLVCRHAFDGASFQGTLRDAYAASGEPTRFLGERATRKRLTKPRRTQQPVIPSAAGDLLFGLEKRILRFAQNDNAGGPAGFVRRSKRRRAAQHLLCRAEAAGPARIAGQEPAVRHHKRAAESANTQRAGRRLPHQGRRPRSV